MRTAQRWWHRYETEQHVNTRPMSGRNRITSAQEDREIVQRFKDNPFERAVNLAREYVVSKSTVAKRLSEEGIKCHIAAKQARLTEDHRLYRLAFCENMMERNLDNCIFTDEKSFASDLDPTVRVWRLDIVIDKSIQNKLL